MGLLETIGMTGRARRRGWVS